MSTERTVVVADDSPTVRATIAYLLEGDGFTVRTATNGREALELVRKLRPRVVLLDAMMPEMDGFEVCRAIREEETLADTRVIMLTAMGQDIDRERALAVGVDHFLTKPFDHDEAVALLDGAFKD